MRTPLIGLLILALQLSAAAQGYWAVGKYLPGFLHVYSITASGEITDVQTMDEFGWGEKVLLDRGGRMVALRDNYSILLYRIGSDHALTLASSTNVPENTWYSQSIALSQDGRVILVLFADDNVNPRHYEFRTLLVNNRLQLVETGHAFDRDLIEGGIGSWTITDYPPYHALVVADSVVNLSLSASGEISGPVQVHDPPYLRGGSRDWSSDGRWNLRSNQQNDVDFVMNESLADGIIQGHDTAGFTTMNTIWDCMFMPNLRGVVVAATPGLFTVGLNQDMTFAGIIDHESVGFNNVYSVAVSHDSRMVLTCDQDVGFDFPLYSYFLDPDTGELTSTGHTLSRPDFHADLRFIPPPTLPTLMGDANVDGVVNAADVVFLVNEALPDDKPILYPQNFANADFDNDIDVDEDDLNALIGMLLGT